LSSDWSSDVCSSDLTDKILIFLFGLQKLEQRTK
jgi:hypothetical protein